MLTLPEVVIDVSLFWSSATTQASPVRLALASPTARAEIAGPCRSSGIGGSLHRAPRQIPFCRFGTEAGKPDHRRQRERENDRHAAGTIGSDLAEAGDDRSEERA